MTTDGPVENTDVDLWRESPGDYYANRIFRNAAGGVGIDVGGHCIVLPLARWHELAKETTAPDPSPAVPVTHAQPSTIASMPMTQKEVMPNAGDNRSLQTIAVTGGQPSGERVGAPATHATATPEKQPNFSAWDEYWASLDADSQQNLTDAGIEGAQAWFGIGAAHNLRAAEERIKVLADDKADLKRTVEMLKETIARLEAENAKLRKGANGPCEDGCYYENFEY